MPAVYRATGRTKRIKGKNIMISGIREDSLLESEFIPPLPAGALAPGNEEQGQLQQDDLALLVKQIMHDVRSDLVTLTVMAKLLKRGYYGKLSRQVEQQIEAMERKAQTATGMVENYCSMAVIAGEDKIFVDEGQGLDLESQIIHPVLQELSVEIAAKEVAVFDDWPSARLPCPVRGNRMLLRSVFRTLFQNAVRHCKVKSLLTCGIEAGAEKVCVSIVNEGVVVPEHLRQRIFEQFVKGHNGNPDAVAEGLGMGLFLARSIVHKHGGDIWYEALPHGSKFVLTLPRAI